MRGPEDDAYLALADKMARLAEAAIAKSDTAEMELYAGMGYALRARLLGLRYEKMPTARAGVEARKHFLRCLELDPNMADAYTGLGVYNYLADALSAMAKVLRFFMGIPGGNKRVGLHQLEMAAAKGETDSDRGALLHGEEPAQLRPRLRARCHGRRAAHVRVPGKSSVLIAGRRHCGKTRP